MGFYWLNRKYLVHQGLHVFIVHTLLKGNISVDIPVKLDVFYNVFLMVHLSPLSHLTHLPHHEF